MSFLVKSNTNRKGPKFIKAMPDVAHRFIQIRQFLPLTEEKQLQEFGCDLRGIMMHLSTGYSEITTQDWQFIIHLCMEHSNIDYFVTCILQIIKILLRMYPKTIDSHIVIPQIYNLLVFLTKQFNENYWGLDIVQVWVSLFYISKDIPIQFCNEVDVFQLFLDILKTPCRGDIIPSNECTRRSFKDIIVSDNLQRIKGNCFDKYCFNTIYVSLMKRHKIFQRTTAKFWPFLLQDDGKLEKLQVCENKITEMNREEHYPKSANTKRKVHVLHENKNKKLRTVEV
jgi:hypothetical protein